jgi:hypothetical protein
MKIDQQLGAAAPEPAGVRMSGQSLGTDLDHNGLRPVTVEIDLVWRFMRFLRWVGGHVDAIRGVGGTFATDATSGSARVAIGHVGHSALPLDEYRLT